MKNKKRKRVSSLLLLVMICLSFCLTVYGSDDVDARKFIVKDNSAIGEIVNSANSKVGKVIMTYSESTGVVTFSNKKYNKLETDGKEDFMTEALLATKESGLEAQVKNKLYNFIADQDGTTAAAIKYLRSDTSADLAAAMSWLDPVTGVISTCLGFFCLVTFSMMSMSLVADMAFLALPIVSFRYIEKNKKPFWLSKEAWESMRECENSTEYKSVVSIYISRRVGTMVLVAICLLYLVSGQIYDLFAWVIDSFGNISHYMFPD